MELSTYLAKISLSQSAFGSVIGVTQGMVSQWCGRLIPTPEHCVSIEQATNGQVTRKDLRPDDWERIWPELAEKADA